MGALDDIYYESFVSLLSELPNKTRTRCSNFSWHLRFSYLPGLFFVLVVCMGKKDERKKKTAVKHLLSRQLIAYSQKPASYERCQIIRFLTAIFISLISYLIIFNNTYKIYGRYIALGNCYYEISIFHNLWWLTYYANDKFLNFMTFLFKKVNL